VQRRIDVATIDGVIACRLFLAAKIWPMINPSLQGRLGRTRAPRAPSRMLLPKP